jgi:hypothetical protein
MVGRPAWLVLSLAVALGYAVGVVIYELATPWWAGDDIGLSLGACLFYALGGLIWAAVLNLVYGVVWFSEKLAKPARLDAYRSRAYAIVVGAGAASWPTWLAATTFAAWLRR